MRDASPEERHIAALKAELARARFVAAAKGKSPHEDDRCIELFLELEKAEHVYRYALMRSDFGRLP